MLFLVAVIKQKYAENKHTKVDLISAFVFNSNYDKYTHAHEKL